MTRIIGRYPDGRPIHLIAGGDEAPPADPPADPPGADPAGDDAPPPVDAKALEAARREAARYRTENKRLLDAAKARDDAEKSELQRAQERIAAMEKDHEEAQRALRTATLRASAQTEAIRLGYIRPERAWREIDMEAVESDEDGEATNLAKLLEDELRARPELKAAARPPDAGAGQRGKPTLTVDQIRRMDADQINARWDEVQEVLGHAGR